MNDDALARNTDPSTSKAAAKSVKTTPLMMRLLAIFAKKSMTSEMAAEEADLLHIGYWKRVSDLLRVGYIEPRTQGGVNLTWVNRSGRQAQVWKITAAGREALRAYKGQNLRAA